MTKVAVCRVSAMLTNWTAKRAGGRITITGVDQDGQPRKIVGVDTITAGKLGDPPVAVHMSGTRFELR